MCAIVHRLVRGHNSLYIQLVHTALLNVAFNNAVVHINGVVLSSWYFV